MSGSASSSGPEPIVEHDRGPSGEMRRFSAGIRLVTALLCSVLLTLTEGALRAEALALLLGYATWSGWVLWREATGRSRRTSVWLYWVDVTWTVLVMRLVDSGSNMLTLTLVHPVVLASIGFDVHRGVLLALYGAAGLILDGRFEVLGDIGRDWTRAVPALTALALVPAAALLARPMSLLRRRLALIESFEAQLDPRRGLEPVCLELVERLRASTGADVVALVLPQTLGSPACVTSRTDGSFRASDEAHRRFESQLASTPAGPVSFVARRRWDPRPRIRFHAAKTTAESLAADLAALAVDLEVFSLHVLPLTRYGHRHGHFIVGYARPAAANSDAYALAASAPELLRIIEQATLVDQLQEETASHERARIGRDLHDSAIQPYLGLKYAVECVALRIPTDNPARGEVNALADLVNGEVAELRELISSLRSGGRRGDDALVPAVRRQVRRFALLFGIDVEIDCPESIPTTRALAISLFHIVNEALNNVRKHTGARRVWVALATDGDAIRLTLRDDAGSRLGQPSPPFRPASLNDRVAELGGTLHIGRPDGLNTELVIRIPC